MLTNCGAIGPNQLLESFVVRTIITCDGQRTDKVLGHVAG
jgi:hypothetical protein